MGDDGAHRFRYRGRSYTVRGDPPLASALARKGVPILQRSIRYHRPRAPFCGVGACTQCLVRVNGVPNVRACRYSPAEGDRIASENAWPSPAYDLLGALDLLFARGLDTLHGFRRPAWAAPIYHRVIRRLAGFGRLADAAPPAPVPPLDLSTEVLVVGAGAAGRAAAARLAGAGREVLLLDRGPVVAPPEGVRALPGTTATFLPPPSPGAPRPFALLAAQGLRGVRVRAGKVVLAPGAYDASLLFSGNDRPGVLTAEGAIALAPAGEPPFRRALLVGGGRRAAELLERFGSRIEAIVAPASVHGAIAEAAAHWEIPVYPRTLLAAATGRRRVRGARLRGRGRGPSSRVGVDAIVLAHRRLPNAQLFFQVGARMHWRGAGGAYYPQISEGLTTSVPGLYAAGAAAGFDDPVASEASGLAAAEALLGSSPHLAALPPRVGPDGPHELEGYYQELLSVEGIEGRTKWIGCACEDVLLRELVEAHRAGYRGIEVMKRYTGLGTGLCQGRYCVPEALLLLSLWEGRPPAEVGYITQRPPVLPTALAAWAELSPTEAGAA
jgi:sarcosine oxidase subunit alpha